MTLILIPRLIQGVTKTVHHLKNISKVRQFLSQSNTARLLHVFITSRLDYFNALLSGLPKNPICQLQFIQNAAARVLTKTKRGVHITPILSSKKLPVIFHNDFKIFIKKYTVFI